MARKGWRAHLCRGGWHRPWLCSLWDRCHGSLIAVTIGGSIPLDRIGPFTGVLCSCTPPRCVRVLTVIIETAVIYRHSEDHEPYLWAADKNSPLRWRWMAFLLQILANAPNPTGCSAL